MAGLTLMDVAPPHREVPIGGGESITVTGVTVEGIAVLLGRFPAVQKALAGGAASEVTTEDLMKIGPEAVRAIIAAGCGFPGDSAAEKKAAALPAEVQADLLAAIIELTLPSGIGPFVEKLTAMFAAVGDGPTKA